MHQDWRGVLFELEQLWAAHSAEPPLQRRALSWARTVSFARALLGVGGEPLRRGTASRPFTVWLLGATNEVEVALAQAAAFDDVNLPDRAPTEVILMGRHLVDVGVVAEPAEGAPPFLRCAGFEAVSWLRPPDFAAVLMPAALYMREADPAGIPLAALEAVAGVPVVFSTRCELPADARADLDTMGDCLVLPQVRCPFSSAAGDESMRFAENGWILAVKGPHAAAYVLQLRISPAAPVPETTVEREAIPFWGILDLKFDRARPVFERVRLLETGDGRISKFSGHGAEISASAHERFRLEEGPALRRYRIVAADKKLTHDLVEMTGYGHLLLAQVCCPRHYDDGLADRIVRELAAAEGDLLVLKLCNRSRAAGVVVVPVGELDEVLEELLAPPRGLEAWFRQQRRRLEEGFAAGLGFAWGSFDEQLRHWWSNECPCFLVEQRCASSPIVRNGASFDGTMRVAFALKRPAGDATSPLEVEWLGGYWKLPKEPAGSASLRERVVSAASVSGTAPVDLADLHEVYSALGDVVPQLFSLQEPTPAALTARYHDRPELAAYFVARLAAMHRDPSNARRKLEVAAMAADRLGPCAGRACVKSLVARGQAVLAARRWAGAPGDWRAAVPHLQASLAQLPTNANSLYLLGMARLELNELPAAEDQLIKSLLLDPDFKAPYVGLAIVALRQAQYERAVEVSEACLRRHPATPMCHYHIGVACCQLALELEAREAGGVRLLISEAAEFDTLRERAQAAFRRAQESDEATRRRPHTDGTACEPAAQRRAPWTEADERMVQAMSVAGRRSGATHRLVALPPDVGWRLCTWRF